ncbi:MAG: hypothetical protein AB7O67_16730 [Vicinamibacterales bacterium]
MAWGRLHDGANSAGKLLALSDAAWRMWGCGLIYCQANLTDGFIPDHAIEAFGVRARNKRAVVDELCASLVPGKGPLWHRVAGGYQVHDYLDWNDDRETVLKGREQSAARMARYRERLRSLSGAGVTHNRTRNTTQNKRRSFGGSTSTTTPVPSEQGTAPLARRDARDVWKVAMAIGHAVFEDLPDACDADRTEEFKVRCALQDIDYAARGGDQDRPLYARALEYVAGVRARRKVKAAS